jgi:hypothetical protein
MPPPGAALVARARWNHEQREGSIAQPCLDPEALVRLARSSPEIAALNIGQSRLSRIVRAYIAERVDRPTYGTLDDIIDSGWARYSLIEWVTSYADPTAREAVRNVDRERGWR